MGTRNLTAVFMDGEYKVAQYGQWDGYPEGQGTTCLVFLRDEMDENKFREQLKKVHFANKEELYNLYAEFGANQDGSISMRDYAKFKNAYPELHRDTAANVLKMIQDGNVRLLKNDIDFAADGLFCEWAYVIDLDKRRFEVYTGFHREPLTESDRFYFLKDKEAGNGYSGIHMVCWFVKHRLHIFPVAGSRQRVEIFSAIRMPKKYYPTLTRLPSDILLLAGLPAGLDYITSLQGKAQSSDLANACPGTL